MKLEQKQYNVYGWGQQCPKKNAWDFMVHWFLSVYTFYFWLFILDIGAIMVSILVSCLVNCGLMSKTQKLVFVASPLSTRHVGERSETGWQVIKMM